MKELDRRFALAVEIESGISRDGVLSGLASRADRCAACHSGYRAVTPAMQEGGQ